MGANTTRDRQVQRIILVEGAANVLVLIGKLIVGISTGSIQFVHWRYRRS